MPAIEEKEISEKKTVGRERRKIAAKIGAFILIFCLLLSAASAVFEQFPNGSDNGIVGFYDLPDNSLQTVVLGQV